MPPSPKHRVGCIVSSEGGELLDAVHRLLHVASDVGDVALNLRFRERVRNFVTIALFSWTEKTSETDLVVADQIEEGFNRHLEQ